MCFKRILGLFGADSSTLSNDPLGNHDAAGSRWADDDSASSEVRSMPSKTAADLARTWWREHPDHEAAVCDRCNAQIENGTGYLRSAGLSSNPDLLCESCWYAHLGKTSPAKLWERKEAFKRRKPRRIDYRPSRPTGIGFDPPLPLSETDYGRLSDAVRYKLRADEPPFGICRFCNEKHRSACPSRN